MGQTLHGSARTTEAIRREIQHSQESLKVLASRYGINPKTVAKWRKRQEVQDAAMGPKEIRSTVLTLEQEAAIVAFRKLTLLPLDDCLYALQPSIPALTVHRCTGACNGTVFPVCQKRKTIRQKKNGSNLIQSATFHIDIAEVQTEEGRLYLFVAIDRTSKYVYAELHPNATRLIASNFLTSLVAAVPYDIHTILTDNGIQFAKRKGTEAYRTIHLTASASLFRLNIGSPKSAIRGQMVR